MRNSSGKEPWKTRLEAWVDGDRETQDRTLFIMEHRPRRYTPPTEEEHEARERSRLSVFLDWYPAAAVCLCALIVVMLIAALLDMPAPGVVQPAPPAENGSWELELLGESFVLFLAMSGVRVLMHGRRETRKRRHFIAELGKCRVLLGSAAAMLLLVLLVHFLGGIAGGALLGAALGVPPLLRGRYLARTLGYAQAISLLLCVVLFGAVEFAGSFGMTGLAAAAAPLLEVLAGLAASCAVYGVCSLAAED